MEVILLEHVEKLGRMGDKVNVKNGYARNFLLPRKVARRATAAALQEFEARRAELEKLQAEKLAAAQAQNEKLNGQTFTLVQKAGVDGRLFGSVTTMDIANALKAAGFEDLVKTQVRLIDGHLKAVGEYPVQVALHPDVIAEINVVVQGDVA